MSTQIQQYENVLQTVQKEDSLISAFTEMKDKLFIFSPDSIQNWEDDKKDMFIRKTMMKIAHDEKLAPCFESGEGKISLIDAVTKCCSTGLEIDGKHAYLIPQGKKIKQNGSDIWVTEARFSIKASGYFALLCGGDKPIFDDLRWALVYEKDDCKIKAGTGEIDHDISVTSDRGEVIGCWVQITKKTGQKEAIFYPMKKVMQWAAKSKSNVWKEWKDEMTEQACIRHACDKYEQARDLLTASWYNESPEEKQEVSTTTDIIDEALKEHEENKEVEESVDNTKNWD